MESRGSREMSSCILRTDVSFFKEMKRLLENPLWEGKSRQAEFIISHRNGISISDRLTSQPSRILILHGLLEAPGSLSSRADFRSAQFSEIPSSRVQKTRARRPFSDYSLVPCASPSVKMRLYKLLDKRPKVTNPVRTKRRLL